VGTGEDGLKHSFKPRLLDARYQFLGSSRLSVEDLVAIRDYYVRWRDFNEYLVLQRQEIKPDYSIERQTIAVKCSKRGNDVYRWRVRKRFHPLLDARNEKVFFKERGKVKRTQCLFITLTWDTSRCGIQEAWENVGKDFNRYISGLRRKFGKISHLRVFQTFKNGYPHIHAILLFKEFEFVVFNDRKGKYRVHRKKELKGSWHSFVDIQAVKSFNAVSGYMSRYLSRGFGDPRGGRSF
jgi:hypothetical protein